jgi:hypothetical protein
MHPNLVSFRLVMASVTFGNDHDLALSGVARGRIPCAMTQEPRLRLLTEQCPDELSNFHDDGANRLGRNVPNADDGGQARNVCRAGDFWNRPGDSAGNLAAPELNRRKTASVELTGRRFLRSQQSRPGRSQATPAKRPERPPSPSHQAEVRKRFR